MINANPNLKRLDPIPTSRPAHDRAPNDEPLMLRSASAVFESAALDPGLRVNVFQSDWAAIDLNRARAAREGVHDRVAFHHKLAWFCPFVRAAIARARTVIIDDP